MRYTLEQAMADESLPLWWTEKGCPDWARDDAFRDIPPDLALEVRYGLTESTLKERLRSREAYAHRKAKRDAERAAESPEQRTERERHKRAAQRLARLRSAVTMRTRMLAEAIEAKQQGRFTGLCERNERAHLERAQKALADHVDAALMDEFTRLENAAR